LDRYKEDVQAAWDNANEQNNAALDSINALQEILKEVR